MSERMISSLFTARLIRAATLHRVPADQLWACAGVHVSSDDYPPIAESRHLDVWELVMRHLDDPGFPIKYAHTMSIDDYGLLGLAFKTAPDVGGGLAVLERFLAAYVDTITVSLARTATTATVTVCRDGTAGLGLRCSIESVLAELLHALRAISGRSLAPRAATFAHPAPRDLSDHARHFGVVPTFSAPRNALVFRNDDFALPLVRADRALHRYLVGELAKLAQDRAARRVLSWTARTRTEILRMLPRCPDVHVIAKALGASQRTLQRHLRAEGTSFQATLEDARKEVAEALLGDQHTSVAEVAAATGFSTSTSFGRAYRRWTGHAPRIRSRRGSKRAE